MMQLYYYGWMLMVTKLGEQVGMPFEKEILKRLHHLALFWRLKLIELFIEPSQILVMPFGVWQI